MVNPLNPTPKPSTDPVIEEIEKQRAKEKAEAEAKKKADAKAKADAQKEREKNATKAKDATDWYKKLLDEKVNIPIDGKNQPFNIQQVLGIMSQEYINYKADFDRFGHDEAQRAQAEKNFIITKKAFQTLATRFEKKYNKSFLDVANDYNTYYKTSTNPNPSSLDPSGIVPNILLPRILPKDLEVLKVVLDTDPSVKVKPPTVKATPSVGTTDTPIKTPDGWKAKSYYTVGDFTRTEDASGNPVFMFNGNESYTAVPIALIGDANGNAMRTTYNNKFNTEGIDPNSPVTTNGALNTFIQQLQSTPDGVKKFKQLAIAKHIIPPSAANRIMSSDLVNIIDGTTQKAINYLINAVTGHNVTLADMGKPNQKFMGVNDYLNNMPALSISTTETSQVHQQIQPKDYELSIDQMFQNILGRGATADELKDFTNKLQTYSNANPQVTTKTTTETTTGSSASATVSGGLSDAATGAMMRDEALKNPEAEAFNKGSKFFDWFQEAIGSPVQLGG